MGAELTGREGAPGQVPPQGHRLYLYRCLFMVEPGWPGGGPDPDMGIAGSPKCTLPESGGGCHSVLYWVALHVHLASGAGLSFHSLHSRCHSTAHPTLQTVYALLTQLCNKRSSEIPTQAAVQKTAQLKWPWKMEGPWTFLDSNFNFARSYRTNNDFS